MRVQRTRRPSLRSGRSRCSLGSPLTRYPFGAARLCRSLVLFTCILVLGSASPSPSGSTVKTILVHVDDDSSPPIHLSKARVFILSSQGGLIEEATTNSDGVAELPIPEPASKPSLLLAELASFDVSGHRFREAAVEYCITLKLSRTCDFVTVGR